MKSLFPLCLGILLASHAFPQQLDLRAIQVTGRHAFTINSHIELIGSSSHFFFQIDGLAKIAAYVPKGHNDGYLQYTVNDKEPVRVRVKSGDTTYIKIDGPSLNTIGIHKATEARTGPVFISSITGNEPRISLLPSPAKGNIEFIGNSITCGAAADESDLPCNEGNYHDHHNGYNAYGPRVARALDMDYVLSSVSGIGIYRNWNSSGPTMPQVYHTLSLDTSDHRLYNTASFTPDIVCIALGTNDFSEGDAKTARLAFDSAKYVTQYIAFVEKIHSAYPAATIALLSSPMLQGKKRALLERCIVAVTKNVSIKPYHFFFKEMQAVGCSGHPSVAQHGELANELLPFLNKLLKERNRSLQ